MKALELAGSALSIGLLGIAAAATLSVSTTAQINPFPVNSPVATYGTGGAGTGGIAPTIGTNSLPRIGNLGFEIQAENVVGGSWGLLLWSTVGCDVPYPGLGRLYVQSGALWPTQFVVDGVPGVAGAGSASIPVPIPRMPVLIGATAYAQGFFADSQAAVGGGISHTQGLMLTCTVAGWTNSLGMEFAKIPAGTFTMGSPTTELYRYSDEVQHQVTLTKSFWMQTTEVTQAQWQVVMGSNPSYFQGANLPVGESGTNRPVEYVSWNDIQTFLATLNALEPGANYRLPTEAEWEYACRAGSTAAYSFGDSAAAGELDPFAWYGRYYDGLVWHPGTAGDFTHSVAMKAPNAWGLYDMHGNVWEWCQDWWGYYPTTAVTDPQGPGSGAGRVARGGIWSYNARLCRSANRYSRYPTVRNDSIGFRLLRPSP